MEAGVFVPWRGWSAVSELGEGGFGKVYEIHRTKGGVTEKAAMKVITIPKNESEVEYLVAAGYDKPSITSRFDSYKENVLREYGIMAKMKGNTNIVYCDDVEEIRRDSHGWNIYIRMELLTPLLKAMDSVQEEAQIIRLAKDLCGALIACQKHSIIHRDIKPQNVFVSPDGTFKLGDFGIARTLEHTTRATAGIGTYNYMAPEVLHKKAYNQTVDIYSLGLMLYWLLNARRGPFMPLPPAPMTHSAEEEAFRRRMSGDAIPEPMKGSPAFRRIVMKACAFDPGRRYQTAEAMLRDLEALSGKQNSGYSGTATVKETRYGATVLDDEGSSPYRNLGVGKVERVGAQPGGEAKPKTPPRAERKPETQPKADRKPETPPKAEQKPKAAPKAKPKKKSKTFFVWLILLALGFIGVLVNSPELQDKLGIALTKSKEETVILSETASDSYPGAAGAPLTEVLETGVCEHMGFTDGSYLLMYYDEYDRERIRVYREADGSVAAHFEAEYDDAGNMLVHRGYMGQSLEQTIEWVYNSLGKETSWRKTDGTGILLEQASFTYDDGGFLQDVLCTDSYGEPVFTTHYSYSPDGMGYTVTRNDADGFVRTWTYNALDQCVEFRYVDASGNQHMRTIYTYDGEGNKVLAVDYDPQDNQSYTTEYAYTSDGRLSRENIAWADGSKTEYSYYYDSRGREEKHTIYNSYVSDGEVNYAKSTEEDVTDIRGTVIRSYSKDNDGSLYISYYSVEGDSIGSEIFDSSGRQTSRMHYELDENGDKIRINATYFYEDGGCQEAVMNGNWEDLSSVTYDADGNKTEWMETKLDDRNRITEKTYYHADGSISSIDQYKYLDDGTLEGIAHTYFHDDGAATETLFDANWNPQYKSTMDETGITNEVYYTYGADGTLERVKDITWWIDRSYTVTVSDGDYNYLTKETYDSGDNLLTREEYLYDDRGRKSMVIYSDFDGNVIKDEYIYGADGEVQDVIRHEG